MRIKEMASYNGESLEVDYYDLAHETGEQNICYFLPEAPVQVLACLDRAATDVVTNMYPFYTRVTPEIHVRIRGLPVEEDIRMLRQLHLNMLVRTTGVVTTTTGMNMFICIIGKFDS